ncbi:MAG: PDZ domain-containing protein [Acidobacteria bacterium]|nr:PDZ domain-containing protein [Acidobacteriota bacterium]
MFHKGKILVFLGSLVIVLYGVSAAFYGKVVAKDEAYKEISVFIDVLNRIADDYVEEPDMTKVQDGAMRGLIGALDPYCSFLSGEEYESLEQRRASGRAGAGMVLSKRSDAIYVVSCEQNGPAAQAGIRPGDYLISVNGQIVEDKSILEAESFLVGEPGTKVQVEIFRSSRSNPMEVELILSVPSGESVRSEIMDGNTGLLDVESLANASLEQVRGRLLALISQGADKLVLDLRDCADGDPEQGAELANFFIRDGIIGYSQNRLGEKVRILEADPGKYITGLPLVAIINGSTASAAEITAGALKDRNRATIVGEKSFGVGSSQKKIELKSGAVLVLSTAKYYTPGGKVIQDEAIRDAGILPDVAVPDDETRQDLAVESYYDDRDEAMKYRQLREKIDRIQLEKALDVLSGEAPRLEEAA